MDTDIEFQQGGDDWEEPEVKLESSVKEVEGEQEEETIQKLLLRTQLRLLHRKSPLEERLKVLKVTRSTLLK